MNAHSQRLCHRHKPAAVAAHCGKAASAQSAATTEMGGEGAVMGMVSLLCAGAYLVLKKK